MDRTNELIQNVPGITLPKMRDLKSPKLIWLKAILFVGIGTTAGGLLLLESFHLKTGLLLLLTIWSFCRCYYFAFYALEKYVDPQYRFAGLWSLGLYVFKGSKKRVHSPGG